MACLSNSVFCFSGLYEAAAGSPRNGGVVPVFCCSVGSSRVYGSSQKGPPLLAAEFRGRQIAVSDRKDCGEWSIKSPASFSLHASGCVSRAMRWWEKSIKPNMVEINSAQELVSALLRAGDALVVVDFYSPGCGGCRALHPKVSQLAELYPDAIFLKVNYEELRTMCECLHIRVLPFFQFYRGADGRIKKFKDALAKHGSERCSNGPAKGLDESELLRLASCREITTDLLLPGKENRLEDLVVSTIGNISGAISGMATNQGRVSSSLKCLNLF
ncbi:hypothetical protein CDL15_Pgr014705 [Punica granatum]|uniref:Thioredoxin domain-containing protein n=1 Tax=Punica granatum TaxID=22663 RepID=A0A218Y1H4_PUNGR|nr:hypothetical protein CDL15_Pgr014705 [Punica granatum]